MHATSEDEISGQRRSYGMNRIIAALMLGLCLASAPASAQISLPGVPSLPDVGGVLSELPDAGDVVDTRALQNVRELRVRELLRNNRRVLEADPDGQPIIRSQILALSPSGPALDAARAAGFSIVSTDELGEIGAMVTLRAPQGMSTRRALRLLRRADPQGVFDFDHLHIESGALAPALSTGAVSAANGARIGVIDTGVDGQRAIAAQRGFAGERPIAGAHGGVVSSLILSAAPAAQLYVADIYGGSPTGGASSAMTRALAWLAEQRTPVINVSLVGPRNRIVEAAVAQLVRRGFLIVAAVGNDGPAAPPLYPAAYPGVVGVTGVDQRGRVLVEAGRGPQVDFAALGMAEVAASSGRATRVRGTSYASPIVAALLALETGEPSAVPGRSLLEAGPHAGASRGDPR
jgi:hypothetical protein